MTLQELQQAFYEKAGSLGDLKASLEGIPTKRVMHEVEVYSEKLGKILSNLLQNEFSGMNLSNEEVYGIIKPLLLDGYGQAANATQIAQNIVNQRMGIGMKAAKANTKDVFRINNYADKLAEEGIEQAGYLLDTREGISICRAGVTDTVRINAAKQEEAGLGITIRRYSESGCCKWCDGIAGTYHSVKDLPEDFWLVHTNCNCQFDYMPSKSKWTRITFETREDGSLKKNTVEI